MNRIRLLFTCFTIVLLSQISCGGSGSSAIVDRSTTPLNRIVLASGLSQPMQYKANPVNSDLAYVLERTGKLRVMVKDRLQRTPVIDLAGILTSAGQGGLLGMAFDPDFQVNKYIFLHYAVGNSIDTQVSRFTLDGSMMRADLTTMRSIIRIGQAPFVDHKGASINFGKDGYLYMAMGDGGNPNDQFNRAQTPNVLLGKILRIDPTGDDFPSDLINNYKIPSSNPFRDVAGVRGEIWGFGMRNPFRWTVDEQTGGLIIADVGQEGYEEVDFEPAGQGGRNYGWKQREGFYVTTNPGPAFSNRTQDPFVVIDHPIGKSITGGFVYRGSGIRALNHRYLFSDYVTNRFWSVSIDLTSSGEAQKKKFTEVIDHTITGGLNGVVSIDPDTNGEPIITELNRGSVSRLIN